MTKKTLVQQRQLLQASMARSEKELAARNRKLAKYGCRVDETREFTFAHVEQQFADGPARTLVNIATSTARSQWGTGWRMLPEETRKAYVCLHVARCITENCNKISIATALEALMLAQLPPSQ